MAVALDLPVVTDGVVLLRPFGLEDADVLAAIWMDPTIRARNGVPEPSTEAAVRWVARSAAGATAGEAWEWAIVDAGTGQLAGRRALKHIDWQHRRASAACWIAPGHRGRQFAARSLRLAAAHAFARGIIRVEAACESDNDASIRSTLTAGMRREGTLRSYFISNAGVPVDAQMFGLVPDDLANAPAFRPAPLHSE